MASNTNKSPEESLDELQWIILRRDMDNELRTETFSEKFKRKFLENPLIPIGKVT